MQHIFRPAKHPAYDWFGQAQFHQSTLTNKLIRFRGCILFKAWCELGYMDPSKAFYYLDCICKMGIIYPPELQLITNKFRKLAPPRVLQLLAITGIKFVHCPPTSSIETITGTLMLQYTSLAGLFMSYFYLICINTFWLLCKISTMFPIIIGEAIRFSRQRHNNTLSPMVPFADGIMASLKWI